MNNIQVKVSDVEIPLLSKKFTSLGSTAPGPSELNQSCSRPCRLKTYGGLALTGMAAAAVGAALLVTMNESNSLSFGIAAGALMTLGLMSVCYSSAAFYGTLKS